VKDLKRIYVLEYAHHPHGQYSNEKGEKKQLVFNSRQRQEFIDEYLIALSNDFAYSDIHCYCVDYGDHEITDMNKVIEAI